MRLGAAPERSQPGPCGLAQRQSLVLVGSLIVLQRYSRKARESE